MTPKQKALAEQKALARAESKFRRGMAIYEEGRDRPFEYSPEQLGWDAAQAKKPILSCFMAKAREDFGV